MKSMYRSLGIALAAGTVWLSAGLTAQAQEAAQPAAPQEPGVTVQQLLQQLRDTKRKESAENARRIREFQQARNRQSQLLRQAEADLARERELSEQLKQTKATNEEELALLEQQLTEALGAYGELFGVVRQIAGDTRANLNRSLISAQYPDRGNTVEPLTRSRQLPTVEDLGQLWYLLLQEADEQGKVTSFTTTVLKSDGTQEEAEVLRVGPFTAVDKSSGNFLRFEQATGKLQELGRQPPGKFRDAARQTTRADAGEQTVAPIDPSQGTLLEALVDTPSISERVNEAGYIGYTIIILGILGILLAVFRLVDLIGISSRVNAQMKSDTPKKGNPLGRVLMAYEDNKSVDVETLQLKLDDAVLKELPRLELGLATVRILASVAPLLGLLGTVIGMIQVFTSITLYGTGDPKLMAGGISLALMTTVLGLVTAVPLLLLHSFASGRSKALTQVLEEQSAGMVAAHSEAKHK